MDRLRVGYFADGPWGLNSLKLLLNDPNYEIAFLVPRSDTKDEQLRNCAKGAEVPVLRNVKVNSEEFYKQAAAFQCDIFVSMSFNQIMEHQIHALPAKGTINCHAGKLPFYRGRNVLNWALINDEKEFGITVHCIDDGIDTGDIICQEVFPITDVDTYASLLDVAYAQCPIILKKALDIILAGNEERIAQSDIDPVGSYCRRRKVGDEWLDWNQTSREVFNFIRAISKPGPGAHTKYEQDIIQIHYARESNLSCNKEDSPGTVLEKSKDGYFVKTKDSIVEIGEIEPEITLHIGDRLVNSNG